MLKNIKCSDVNDLDARKEFYKTIISKIQDVVDVIDNVVVKMRNENTPITPDMILENVVPIMS